MPVPCLAVQDLLDGVCRYLHGAQRQIQALIFLVLGEVTSPAPDSNRDISCDMVLLFRRTVGMATETPFLRCFDYCWRERLPRPSPLDKKNIVLLLRVVRTVQENYLF